LQHEIPHSLSPEQLEKAVRRFSEVYCERFREYDAQAVWHDPRTLEVRFKVKGVVLYGSLVLGPRALEIEMKVPLAFRLFKGRALRAIEEEVRPWLAAAARGELA
jgi:Putative polyhydroxyalkanoic acid system protein (PHA_gran_rgn)